MEIIPARPDEYDDLVALFLEYNFALRKRRWFDWKHLENPFGEELVFKLIEADELAGTVSLMAQPFRWANKPLIALQAVDALMGRRIRGKGLFNKVMAFVVGTQPAGVESDYFHLGYPSLPGSQKAFENAGWLRLANFYLKTCLLTPRKLRKLKFGPLIVPLLTPIWGLVRFWYFAGADDAITVQQVDRFPVSMNHLLPADRVCGDRSAEFLNWRVCDNPRDDMRVFFLKDGTEITGYAVVKVVTGSWEVVEFRCVRPNRRYFATFLRHLHRERLCDTVDIWLLEGNLQEDVLPSVGTFTRQAGGAMFIFMPEGIDLPVNPDQWAGSFLDSDW